MKRLIIIILIFFGQLSFSQIQDNNVYNQSERSGVVKTDKSNGETLRGRPGNPGKPKLPIDEQLPILILSAVLLIVYLRSIKLKYNK